MRSREGYPDIRTVDYWLGGDKTERFPQSRYVNQVNYVHIILIPPEIIAGP